MEKKLRFNSKGLSAIVTTLILVALSIAAVVLVWMFMNNLIKKEINKTESCFGNFDKIKINEQYTCSGSDFFQFSLMIGDINIEKVIVSVASEGAVNSYEITNTLGPIEGLTMYDGSLDIILPAKNSGLTYIINNPAPVDSIQIRPVIGGTTCDMSDSISEIEICEE